MQVAVVGAGISGLGAALLLQQAGCRVTVFEQESEAGGRMITHREQGFRWDPGAQIMLPQYTQMRRLLRELGLGLEAHPGRSHEALVLPGPRLWRTRFASPDAVLANPRISWRSKLRLAKVGLALARHWTQVGLQHVERAFALTPANLRQRWEQEVGEDAVDYLLSLPSAGFFFWEPQETPWWVPLTFLRLLARWRLLVPAGGMGAVPRALARRLDVRLGVGVTAVRPEPGGGVRVQLWDGAGASEVTVDRVLLAVPAPVALGLLQDPEAAVGRARANLLRAIGYTRTVSVAVGYRKAPEREATGVFVPPALDLPLASIGWEHLKVPGRAPQGAGLGILMASDAFARSVWAQEDSEVSRAMLGAAETLYPGSQPLFSRVYRWEYATPLLAPAAMPILAEAHKTPAPAGARVFLCGDYWRFPTTESALASGLEAAGQILGSRG